VRVMFTSGRWALLAAIVVSVVMAGAPVRAIGQNGLEHSRPAASTGGTWVDSGRMHHARAGGVLLRLHDGRAFAIAEGDPSLSDFIYRSSTEIYSPRTNRWSSAAPLHKRLSGPSGIVLRDGRVLVVGGYVQSESGYRATRTTEIYNPRTGRWSMTGRLNHGRAYAAVAMLPKGRVLVAGGRPQRYGGLMASSEVYNPRSGLWRETDPMTQPRATPWTARLRDGDILIAGGFVRSAERYDVSLNRWRPAGRLSRCGDEPALFKLSNGHVLAIAGGAAGVDEYLPKRHAWRAFPSLPKSAMYMQVVRLDRRPFVLGGWGSESAGYHWHPAGDRWVRETTMPRPKSNFGAVRLLDGSVLVTGGWVDLIEGTRIPTRYAARYFVK
jgi:hypothetical protein